MKIIEAGGYKFFCRAAPGWDDEFCVGEVVKGDVYKMKDWDFKDGVIVDIGANIGTFSIPASKYGKVYAYEPSPTNFKILQMNIALNHANVEAFNYAVGKPGMDTIETDFSGHSRVGSAGGLNGVPVESIGFDDIPVDKINLLKMDCEGGEYNVVKYATTLGKVDRIVGELHSWIFDDKTYEKDHREMIDKLEKYFILEFDGFKNSNMKGRNRMWKQKGNILIDGVANDKK